MIALLQMLTAACLFATPIEDLDALLQALEPTSPEGIAFTETRTSELLAEPVEISGLLRIGEDDTLIKEIVTPEPELLILGARHVELRSETRNARVSTRRQPALGALYLGIDALLRGDAERLRNAFHAEVSPLPVHSTWHVTLAPRDAALARQVRTLRITGCGPRMETIALELVDGEVQEMKLQHDSQSR